VRTADSSDPQFDARPEPVDLTGYTAPMENSVAPVATGFPHEPRAEFASSADTSPASPQLVTESFTPPVTPVEAPAPVAAPTFEPRAPEPEPVRVEAAPIEPVKAEPKVEAVKVEPLPEAPAPTQKKGGWWQRAKSQLTGG
jgi:hypothetical protein